MKKSLLVPLVICLGALGFGGLRASVNQTRATTAAMAGELQARTGQLAEARKLSATLRGEVEAKKNNLRSAARHPNLTPELLKLLEGDFTAGSPAAWAELRRELGLGWNTSPDYVLVNKRVLKNVSYEKFMDAARVSDVLCDLLSLSAPEKPALESALKQAKDNWPALQFQRGDPSGDILAQYTVTQPGADAELSVSNTFVTGLAAAIGPERADLLLPWGWNEFKSQLGTSQAGTLTLRRTVIDGQPDVEWEMKMADQTYSEPVRYAHYPSGWFLTYFPGGWETLAKRESFSLPARFGK
jgi:hypothetical protein